MKFLDFASAPKSDRADAFTSAAERLKTSPTNVEKDFWICAALNELFTAAPKSWPKLAFRGGTSLSKAYGAISRFSEDVDLAISRADLGFSDSLRDLERMNDEPRAARIAKINEAGEKFVAKKVLPRIVKLMERLHPGNPGRKPRLDPQDPLTIIAPYNQIASGDGYIPSVVRLEFSVRTALHPTKSGSIEPYLANALPRANMTVKGVTSIALRRTLWDKIILLHEIKERHKNGLSLTPYDNERVSRHYYDVWRLVSDSKIELSNAQLTLAADCRRHSELFYPNDEISLSRATPGSFDITPDAALTRRLQSDYKAMSVMIFGKAPNFADVKKVLHSFEAKLNRRIPA